jgi:nifR3 family TIM-barrel protein
MELMHFTQEERPIGIQLFGSQPDRFSKAAVLAADRFSPDFIDLNAGCPVPKVTKKNGGAALLKDLALFEKIMSSLVTSVSLPVTVKIRSGWYRHQWVDCEFAQCAEACGAAAVVLHPRSQTMGFSDHSFWERIAKVKDSVKIPVIGNGDISCGDDAVAMVRQTGCDGVMIGRAAYGNPWIFSEIKAALNGTRMDVPSRKQKHDTALRHITGYRSRYGEYRASREMKKHIAWYIKGVAGASLLRDRIFKAKSTGDLETAVEAAFRK